MFNQKATTDRLARHIDWFAIVNIIFNANVSVERVWICCNIFIHHVMKGQSHERQKCISCRLLSTRYRFVRHLSTMSNGKTTKDPSTSNNIIWKDHNVRQSSTDRLAKHIDWYAKQNVIFNANKVAEVPGFWRQRRILSKKELTRQTPKFFDQTLSIKPLVELLQKNWFYPLIGLYYPEM